MKYTDTMDDTTNLPGFFTFDPFFPTTKYHRANLDLGVGEFVEMIYEMQWNSKRDKKLRTLQQRKPFGDDNIFKTGEHNFYQFKFETQSTPKQQDGYNCSLASAICMMRICKALHRIDISSSWIDEIPRAIIPNNLFPSISYNISDPNHLLYVRMDFIKVLDKLQLLQQKAYNKQKPMIFWKSYLAYKLPNSDNTSPFIRNKMSRYDYVNEGYSQTIAGMTEQQILKNAFRNLDVIDHEFVDVFGDGNCVIYQLGNILLYDERINKPKDGNSLSKYLQKELYSHYFDTITEKWKKLYYTWF